MAGGLKGEAMHTSTTPMKKPVRVTNPTTGLMHTSPNMMTVQHEPPADTAFANAQAGFELRIHTLNPTPAQLQQAKARAIDAEILLRRASAIKAQEVTA